MIELSEIIPKLKHICIYCGGTDLDISQMLMEAKNLTKVEIRGGKISIEQIKRIVLYKKLGFKLLCYSTTFPLRKAISILKAFPNI